MTTGVAEPFTRFDAMRHLPEFIAAIPSSPERYLLAGSLDLARHLRSLIPQSEFTPMPMISEASARTEALGGERWDGLLYPEVDALPSPLANQLRNDTALLKPNGFVLMGVPNASHHQEIADLLRGPATVSEADCDQPQAIRGWTEAAIVRLLMDAGYAPRCVGRVFQPMSEGLTRAFDGLLRELRLNPKRVNTTLCSEWLVFRGDLLEPAPSVPVEPVSFVVLVSDEAVLRGNFLASPDLNGLHPHEIRLIRGAKNASALNQGISEASHSWVVCVHQDVYLPRGWAARFQHSLRRAESTNGRIGVAGLYGVRLRDGREDRAGRLMDRDQWLDEPRSLPAAVDTLDELLLAVPKGSPLRVDPCMGWHLYGSDLALAASQRGEKVVVLNAPCFHHSQTVDLPADFGASADYLMQKWAHRLPIPTPCGLLTTEGDRK